jgi:TolB protein
MKNLLWVIIALMALSSCKSNTKKSENETSVQNLDALLLKPEERKFLKNVKQLTFGGNNAEAYWSFDDKHIVFQSDYSEWGVSCDQILSLIGEMMTLRITSLH